VTTTFHRNPGLPRGFAFKGAPETDIDIRPIGLIGGVAATAAIEAGHGRSLAGGPLAYTGCELFLRGADSVVQCVAPLAEILDWAAREGIARAISGRLDLLSRSRATFGGLALDRPRLMGVVNVTLDSFSDGGDFADAATAITRGEELIAAGADIIDIGGESTRPGSAATSVEDELGRVLPVIRALADGGVPLSIDTRRAEVMAASLEAGATMVNDVTALTGDPASLKIVAASGAGVILMHMLGEPRTMQDNPVYGHAPYEILRFFRDRIAVCEDAGLARERIVIDPGVGFGKTDAHNLQLLTEAAIFHGLRCAVAFGASRKSFIGRLAGIDDPKDRLPGTLAALALAVGQGVQIHRVHDVSEARQALAILTPAF